MHIASVTQNTQGISKKTSNGAALSNVSLAKAPAVLPGWRAAGQNEPLIITVNDVPLSSWRLPDDYKKPGDSANATVDDTPVIRSATPKFRSMGPNSIVVTTPHSVLPLPMQFLPIVFRQARLLEQAVSVLEALNPAFAARRRQILCHCGEGFADPESAATAIALEDKAAASGETAALATVAVAGAEHHHHHHHKTNIKLKNRPVCVPLNIHRRRSNWLHSHGQTSA